MAVYMEKRRYDRLESRFDIRVLVDNQYDDINALKFNMTKTVNISASGVLFEYNQPLELNAILNIRFLQPNSFEFFEGHARVVRVEVNPDMTYDIGIEFIDSTDDSTRRLDYFIKK
jgi:hypothetical protein